MSREAKLAGPDLSKEGIAVDDLEQGKPVIGHVDGKPVIVIRTPSGLKALGGRCTHYGGPLGEGLSDGERIHCPWHHAVFDLTTGEAVGAPALDPIPVYQPTERDGRVYATGPVERPAAKRTPTSMPESVVIVGAGAAGAAATETLRRFGYANPVSLIGLEKPVDRPNLSKDYLAGTAPEAWIPIRSGDFYQAHAIDLIHGCTVVRIDPAQRRIDLDDGRRLSYGALLLAPGAEPSRLAIKGADQPHVHYLRSFEDSRAIVAAIDGATHAAIIGAGFIGLEVAASLRHRGLDVTVIGPEEVPLAHAIGETLGRFVRDLHEEHGVAFHLGRKVTEIRADEILLDNDETVPGELVVIGIGVNPRTDLAESAGLAVDNGILVNERLQTSDPHIWAAGDAARYPDQRAGRVRIEHWVLAERHGQTAARNMLGQDLPFTDTPFFWSQHYDVRINVTGYPHDWDQEIVVGDAGAQDVLVGYRKAGTIQAVASIHRDLDSLRAERALASDDQRTLEQLLTHEQNSSARTS
jgi:apoptosis-inducing factor 3